MVATTSTAVSCRVLSGRSGVWPNRHITFIVAEKAQFTVFLALFAVYVGGGNWLKMSYGDGGWLKTLECHHTTSSIHLQ